MNGPASSTDLEEHLRARGIPALELGRIRASGGIHAALLVPDDARLGRGWLRSAGLAGAHLFSPSGGTGRSFRLTGAESEVTLSLFPVDLAEDLLARVDKLDGLDRFRIAAYIQAYFGSPARIMGLDTADDHEALTAIALEAGYDVSIFRNRSALDAELVKAGWQPTHDMLDRLGIADAWLHAHLLEADAAEQAQPPGVAVYFIRQRAMSLGLVEMARAAIQASGFEILSELSLSPDQTEDLRRSTRGGNWRKGPFPVSGGPPAYLFFVLDVFPHPPDAKTRLRHPLLDNLRTLACKERIRAAILKGVPDSRAFNPVHSTDTSAEAVKIASMIFCQEACLELQQTVKDRMALVAGHTDGGVCVEPAANNFVYIRRGTVLRKLYRPHLAGKADAALALHGALETQDGGLGRVLDGSTETGHLDFAAPGEDFRPLAACPLPIDLQAVEQLSDILKGAETAGWRIDESSLFDSLWYSVERSKLVVLGAEGERGEGALFGGMPAGRWQAVLGLPRSVFLNGSPLRRRLWRRLIHPAASGVGWLKRKSRRMLSSLKRLLRR